MRSIWLTLIGAGAAGVSVAIAPQLVPSSPSVAPAQAAPPAPQVEVVSPEYVNDFNLQGRTYRVTVQADAPFRGDASAIGRLHARNGEGRTVPLSTFVSARDAAGPDRMIRYNGYPAADVSGMPAPGYSSGEAVAAMERIAAETLPPGMSFEWTDLTLQEKLAGNAGLWVFPLAVVLAYLILAVQYNSFTLPLAVLRIAPMALLSAIAGIWWTGGDNNVFTQIGLLVLVGLAAKNAILIVEFARAKGGEGLTPIEAAVEAARLRLRPILMTSLAFIMGVVPWCSRPGQARRCARPWASPSSSG